jgi:[acyl-carrier-protein] S-malonyltransferase
VAGAFHTPMMDPAAAALDAALAGCRIESSASVKVTSNASGDYYASSQAVRPGLVRQLTSPVLWQKCMERLLADGVERFYEIGPGRVLTGLMRRIDRKARIVNVSDLASLQAIGQE